MLKLREPVVAGLFYPGDKMKLEKTLSSLFSNADASTPIPKAIIAPHAGYEYSGPIAASAYACLKNAKNQIKRVVILAPSHHYPFEGVAITDDDYFSTPLGRIQIDRQSIDNLTYLPQLMKIDVAYDREHSLEVQLPFLQFLLNDFLLVPLLIGQGDYHSVAEVLEKVWGGEETIVVVSSDLSHYLDYESAKRVDEVTAKEILSLNPDGVGYDQACGRIGINALLLVAAKKQLIGKLIDLRNSGDTTGPKEEVVGYGAFHFYERSQS